MKPNNLTIIYYLLNLALILFLLYFALNQISSYMQNMQNMQNISNDFEIFNRLDSGIYG